MSKDTISFCLWEVIRGTYTSSNVDDSSVRPKAHDVRGLGPSIAFRKNLSIQRVLRAGTWNHQTTLTSFYLKDVTHRSFDTFSSSLVVAAQQVV